MIGVDDRGEAQVLVKSVSPMPRTMVARRSGRKAAGATGAAGPDSTGRPSARHFGRPPSSTTTRSWPNTRIIHQARAAENRPFWS